MWIILDEKAEAESARRIAQQMEDACKEEERKVRLRREHIEATKCPHCGRHDPIPPLLY